MDIAHEIVDCLSVPEVFLTVKVNQTVNATKFVGATKVIEKLKYLICSAVVYVLMMMKMHELC